MKWTEKEINKLKEFNKQGLSPKEISERFSNREYAHIKDKLCKLGLTIQPQKYKQKKVALINKLEKKVLKRLQSQEKYDIVKLEIGRAHV